MGKKNLIRKCAIKVMAQHGYHNTKVQTIADEAGIANGTIYYYFKSKEEILEYIYDVEIEKRLKYLVKIEKNEDAVLRKLGSFINYLFNEWETDFDILKILMQDDIFPINYGSNIRKVVDKLTNKLALLIEEGCRSGELKKVDAYSFASIILNLLRRSIYEFKFDGNSDSYNEKKNQMVDFILDGIRKI